MAARECEVACELKAGSLDRSGTARLRQTRGEVVTGWNAIRNHLLGEGRHQLADEVGRFVDQMSPLRTEKAWLANELIGLARQPPLKGKPLVP